MRVANILKAKGNAVMTIRPNETIFAAAKRLKKEGVGALVVIGDGATVEGVISERDVVNGLAVHGQDFHSLPISALMTTDVVTCSPESSVVEIAKVMNDRRLRHLPVKEGTRLVGIVSIGDVLKSRLDEMELETHVLRDMAIARR